jgi:hypothetical protein
LSVIRAAARPSKFTLGEPLAIGFVPCPGKGQLVGSVTRAAGLPLTGRSFSRFQMGAGRLSLNSTMRAAHRGVMKCSDGMGIGVVWRAHSLGKARPWVKNASNLTVRVNSPADDPTKSKSWSTIVTDFELTVGVVQV